MKKLFLVLLIFSASLTTSAQREYSEQYLGWIRMIKAGEPVKPTSYDNRQFSAKQLSYCNLFISWIQASYTPKGGLGNAIKATNERISPYNQYTRSLHTHYGAFLPTYVFLKKKPAGGWTPENNLGLFLRVIANGLAGDHVDVISTPENYYFYIPGLLESDQISNQKNKYLGFDKHEVLSKYIHYFQPPSIRYLEQYVVLLSRNNQLPWVQITKGEFLQQLGKTVEQTHLENLKKIESDFNETRKKTFRENELKLYKQRLSALENQQAKYKDHLAEKATMYTEQPSIHLEHTPDIFEGTGGQNLRIPVYKYNPAMTPGTKSDSPQWIMISWGGGNMNDDVFKHLHSSMLHNLDYDYIYNYFFNQEKIQAKAYQPLRSPVFEEKAVIKSVSEKTKKSLSEPGTVLFEDFSNTSTGKTPLSWKSSNNSIGNPAITEKHPGLTGDWVVLNGNSIEHRDKIKFPEDFTFSCDIAVPKGFTWGAKRMIIRFGTDKESFLVSMRPGFDGNPGFLYSGPGDFGSSILIKGSTVKAADIPIPGFSNNNPMNQFHLQVRKKGQSLELLVNQKSVFSNTMVFSNSGVLIRGLEFSHSRSDSDSEKYYITNIKVAKD